MGVRSFLKNKIKTAIGKGGAPAPVRSPEPAEAAADFVDAFASLPKDPDADGFYAVAPSALLKEGQGQTFKAGETPVACFRVGGKVFVIDDECTHENGPLGEGHLDGFVVTCPYHDWRFDVRSGDCLSEKDRFVSCFKVKEAGGYIWVGGRQREGSKSRGGEHDDGLNVIDLRGDGISKA